MSKINKISPSVLVVIIVTYNGSDYIVNCLNSILGSDFIPEIIVVDNNSKDNTIQLIESGFKEIHLIKLKHNFGFGYANNEGIVYAIKNLKSKYFFLLNQDTIVFKETLAELLIAAKSNPEFGIISPLHLKEPDTLDHNFQNYVRPFEYKRQTESYTECIHSVPMINAAAWLVSAECINTVGGFDTSMFFHYGEDTNYCQRVLYHGFKIGFIANSKIIHYRSNLSAKSNQIRDLDIILLRNRTTMSDILIADNESEKLYSKYIKSIVLIFFKSQVLLNFKKSRYLVNEFIAGNIFIKRKLIHSRTMNKKKGLTWLSIE